LDHEQTYLRVPNTELIIGLMRYTEKFTESMVDKGVNP